MEKDRRWRESRSVLAVLGVSCLVMLSTLGVTGLATEVEQSWDPEAILKAGLRCRELATGNDREVYYGDPNDFGKYSSSWTGAGFAQIDLGWVNPGKNEIQLSFDPGTGQLTVRVKPKKSPAIEKSYFMGALGLLNYLQLTVVAREDGAKVRFKNFKLNGEKLGNFKAKGPGEWNDWMVTGIDLSEGFTLEGTLDLDTTSGSAELNKLQIVVGMTPPSTVYVDDDWSTATQYQNVAPGLYFGDNAFDTVQGGVDGVGDSTVNVAAGTYNEDVTIDKSLTLNGGQAGVDARGRSASESEIVGVAKVTSAATNVVFDGFKFTSPTRGFHPRGFNLHVESENSTIKNCIFVAEENAGHDWSGYLDFGGITNTTVERNSFSGHLDPTQEPNVILLGITGAGTVTVADNEMHDVGGGGGIGIMCGNAGAVINVEGNVLENTGDGIWVWNPGGSTFDTLSILSNVISGNAKIGVKLVGPIASHFTILSNDVRNNAAGIQVGDGTAAAGEAHYNTILGNAIGVDNKDPADAFDATLNWWGDREGPTHAENPAGTGDAVVGNVIYSPWLGIDPDGNPTTVGVQLVSPMTIIVDVISETGSASHTTLNGNMTLGSGGVLIGDPLQGFRVNGNLTVEALVNAASCRINWCDVYGNMTNNGTGTFDAQYNYWGTPERVVIDGRTTGAIDFDPFLPKNADGSYNDIQAMLNAGLVPTLNAAIDHLWTMVGLGVDVNTYIQFQPLMGAGALAGMGGPGASMGAGAGGTILNNEIAGGGGAFLGVTIDAIYTQGETIDGTFVLTDPLTGDPITDAVVTLSVVQVNDDGSTSLVHWGMITYDEGSGEYVFDFDTSGMAPGIYDLLIQTDDGQSFQLRVEVTES